MAYKSAIQWTDATVNFWTGCKKVSPGCKFCYMYRDKERYGQEPTTVLRVAEKTFYSALTWKEPLKIFTCSWSDFFIEQADEWRADAWDVIRKTPQHSWQILTKRPERILDCLPPDWGDGWPNVWLGVSAENQEMFDLRVPILAKVPAKIRFVSIEPLIGPIKNVNAALPYWIEKTGSPNDGKSKGAYRVRPVHWVIIGGESGNDTGKWRYRECELEWIERIVEGFGKPMFRVPVFVKQLGTHLAKRLKLVDRHGGVIEEFPENLQIREMPTL